jgi:phosphate transport system substrate-binding protein
MRCWFSILVLTVCVFVADPTPRALAADVLRLGGTGAANSVWIRLGEAFNEQFPDFVFEVPPSLGSTGGARAVARGVVDLTAMGREPSAAEIAQGVSVLFCGSTAFLFVANRDMAEDMTRERLVSTYAQRGARWSDGTPLRIILRPRIDSDSVFMTQAIPGLASAMEAARARGEAPTAATDGDNISTLSATAGAFGAMTMIQFATQDHRLVAMRLDGVEPTLENARSGRYPLRKTFCFARGPRLEGPAVKFAEFLTGPVGAKLLSEMGFMTGPR